MTVPITTASTEIGTMQDVAKSGAIVISGNRGEGAKSDLLTIAGKGGYIMTCSSKGEFTLSSPEGERQIKDPALARALFAQWEAAKGARGFSDKDMREFDAKLADVYQHLTSGISSHNAAQTTARFADVLNKGNFSNHDVAKFGGAVKLPEASSPAGHGVAASAQRSTTVVASR